MKTVILAGGAGKRARPLSLAKPKPMWKILGKPLIQHVIETMAAAGLEDFIVVIGYKSEQIRSFLGDGSVFGVNIEYTFQKQPLGMANAVQTAEDLIDDNFFVVNADDIFNSSLPMEMLREFKASGAQIVLASKPVEETWKYGIVKIGEDGYVEKIVEKPAQGTEPSNLAVVGLYILPKEIFSYYKRLPASDSQYEDAMQMYIEDGNIARAVNCNFFASFKYPWDLLTINEYLMKKHVKGLIIADDAEISDKAIIEGDVWIGNGVKIMAGATVNGPCYIGNGTIIGSNTLVRNGASIGDNCVIGFGSEVKRSIIGDDCWLHTNYIGDSIVGDNCKFGAGSVTANFRFDEKNVKMNVSGKRMDTGLNKFGAVVADNCKTGINSSLLPGTKIGPNSIVGPGVCLVQDLEPKKIILINKTSYSIRENKV